MKRKFSVHILSAKWIGWYVAAPLVREDSVVLGGSGVAAPGVGYSSISALRAEIS